jgi:uncharacterized protein
MVAFSGGVDSALLAYVAHKVLGNQMLAVLADGASLSRREFHHAKNFAHQQGIPLRLVKTEEMKKEGYLANEGRRCYYCKQALFERLQALQVELNTNSEQAGWPVVYGVNQDDLGDYRPGLDAAREAEVCSPYLDLEMGKQEIRQLCEFYDLSVAEKPAMPCLASRIPHGREVTPENLSEVERSEDFLFSLGLKECRVRHHGDVARVEVPVDQMPWLMEHREEVVSELKRIGFAFVTLDLQGFRSGSLNEVLEKV